MAIWYCVCKNNSRPVHKKNEHILLEGFVTLAFLVEESSDFSNAWTVVLFWTHSSTCRTSFSSVLTILTKTKCLCLFFLINCLDNSTLFSKFSVVKCLKTLRAQTRFIFEYWDKMSCNGVFEIQHFSANSRTVSRWSPTITSRNLFYTAPQFRNDGLLSRTSSIHSPFRLKIFCTT